MGKFKIKSIVLSGIILLLAWVSFVPQSIQVKYQSLVSIFLIGLLVISWYRKVYSIYHCKNYTLRSLPKAIFLIARKRFSIKSVFNKEDIWLWLFLIGIIGGVFFAENFEIAARQYFYLFIPLVSLYYLLKNEFVRENRLPVIRSICLFSAIVALFGILEWAFHKNPIYEYLNPSGLYYRAFLGKRAMSTQTHPAVLGSYLVACLPFSFLLIKRRVLFDRSLGVFCLILGMSGMILTFSRGSLLGTITLFWVYFWQKNRILFLKYFTIILTIFILTFSFPKIPFVFQRFGIRGVTSKHIFTNRIFRVITSYGMLKDHPFAGVGLNHFRIKCNDYSAVQRHKDARTPENMYLLFLAETGIVGLLGFILFISQLLKKGFQRFYSAKSEDNKDVRIVIIAGLAGLLVNMNTYDLLYWTTPLFLFSMLAGMVSAYSDV